MLGPMPATRSPGRLPNASLSAATAAGIAPATVPRQPLCTTRKRAVRRIVEQDRRAVRIAQQDRNLRLVCEQRIGLRDDLCPARPVPPAVSRAVWR